MRDRGDCLYFGITYSHPLGGCNDYPDDCHACRFNPVNARKRGSNDNPINDHLRQMANLPNPQYGWRFPQGRYKVRR